LPERETPLGGPPVSISVLAAPMKAPEIIVTDGPERVELPSLPLSLPPQSLSPPSLSPRSLSPPTSSPGSRRVILLALAGALLAVGLMVGKLRESSRRHAPFAGSGHVGVFAAPFDVHTFQRGNIHTHTTRSDGKQSPLEVATWYRDHGYQFLAITDHDVLVDPADVSEVETPGFVLIPGEEITSVGNDKPVHVLALCVDHAIASGRFDSALAALTLGIAAVREQNGFAVVNHPNFSWAFGLAEVTPLTGSYGFEIWSGHPASHSAGDATRPSHQALWDELLTRDRRVSAVAVDDEHTLVSSLPTGEALPGRAWVETFGELGRGPVCDALRSGRLYASSGVVFRRIRVEPGRFTVWVDGPLDTVEFLGSAAQSLASVGGDTLVHDDDGFAASYALRGGETYVRVLAKAPDGSAAWTQAYYTNP